MKFKYNELGGPAGAVLAYQEDVTSASVLSCTLQWNIILNMKILRVEEDGLSPELKVWRGRRDVLKINAAQSIGFCLWQYPPYHYSYCQSEEPRASKVLSVHLFTYINDAKLLLLVRAWGAWIFFPQPVPTPLSYSSSKTKTNPFNTAIYNPVRHICLLFSVILILFGFYLL